MVLIAVFSESIIVACIGIIICLLHAHYGVIYMRKHERWKYLTRKYDSNQEFTLSESEEFSKLLKNYIEERVNIKLD
jgi:hypothetical protein